MTRPFTHLHVASGYSLRYGASSPAELIEAATAQGMDTLALTDRDGLYGAVKFATACATAGVAPVLGVDLAVEPSGLLTGLPSWAAPRADPGRTPARGGAEVDPRHPRVTVLAFAKDDTTGLRRSQGWARLCRLVTSTQLRGERGRPVGTLDLVAAHARTDEGVPALAVLLGPGSEFGRAALARRPDVARAVLRRWNAALPAGSLLIEIVLHRGPEGAPGSRGHAVRMLALAHEAGIPAVLTNAVRHAARDGAVTVDVLDAARRLVALDSRHLDRTTAEGYLAAPDEMAARAQEVAEAAGLPAAGPALLARTEELADRCRLEPAAELGVGQSHLPEPSVIGLTENQDAGTELRRRCEDRIRTCYPNAAGRDEQRIHARLDAELEMIQQIAIPTYFLTIAKVRDLIAGMGVRVAARGSGAGSLVNHLLGISGVDPMRHGLLMERFLTPERRHLPDIDLDVESDRRTDVYEKILDVFGADRVTCVSMMDTYRVRHAIRDVGAALGLPPGEIDTIAKAFPHIRARDVRNAIAELPELRASGLGESRLDLLFDLVERLDGLPRHVALHPCGVVISDASLLDRTPVEASWLGFPMSQFDKDDVETIGLLKLDILGIRMQSAMSYAIQEIARVDGPDAARAGAHPAAAGYLDADGVIDLDAVPLDDEVTFRMIRTTHTLGCFQIESPGQRELVGKFGPETFHDLIIDISLFRPGPVKSDMVNPFLRARKGLDRPDYLHRWLKPALENTYGVVVFHEQVLEIVHLATGCRLDQADEVRRRMGSPAGQAEVEPWFTEKALERGYDDAAVRRIWAVLKAFASFGFCKAHAAAFALPTYQSAWLKAHHPAAFLAGVLTHDPGMYPQRLILDDARNLGISVLPLDVNHSDAVYRVERVEPDQTPAGWAQPARGDADPDLPDGSPYGIRLSLAEVKGASEAEVARIVAGRPYHSLADFWHRARVSRPVVERLVLTGAFDSLYGLTGALPVRDRNRITRRDLLLQLADLDRWTRSTEGRGPAGARRARGGSRGRRIPAPAQALRGSAGGAIGMHREPKTGRGAEFGEGVRIGRGSETGGGVQIGRGAEFGEGARIGRGGETGGGTVFGGVVEAGAGTMISGGVDVDGGVALAVRRAASRQSRAAREVVAVERQPVQLSLDLGDAPDQTVLSGLPEMTSAERVRAELEVLGLDASRHVLDFYAPLLTALGTTSARDVRERRNRADLLVAGVKVATQTPPIRTGRRVVFLTLDDSTGPIDATFFEDVQGPYVGTVFHSWLLVVRGVLRRTGARGISLRATGAWELPVLWDAWTADGLDGVLEIMTMDDAAEPAGRRPAVAGLPFASFHSGPAFHRGPVAPADAGAAAPDRITGTHRDDGALPGRGDGDWEAPSGLPSGDRLTAATHWGLTSPSAGARQDAPVVRNEPGIHDGTRISGKAQVAGDAAVRSQARVRGEAGGGPGLSDVRHSSRGDVVPHVDLGGEEIDQGGVAGGAGGDGGDGGDGGAAPGAGVAPGADQRPGRRVLVHVSGYRQSPYADLKPPGDETRQTRRMLAAEEAAGREKERRRQELPRKLWHASPGSSGR